MDFDLLFLVWLGKPVWVWLGFAGLVVALLAFDLGILHKDAHEIGVRESLITSALYIGLGLAFGAWVWWWFGAEPGMNYLTGFALEKALAIDNVFVIATIFAYFAIPPRYQHRVLFWGVFGAIVLRAVMIGVGAAVVERFDWVLWIFAAFLIVTGVKMLFGSAHQTDVAGNPAVRFLRRRLNVTEGLHGQRFFVRLPHPVTGRTTRFVTPLFLALVLIELADVVFAVDSVPAIFAVTTDPFVVYTSNVFAILGLRALYFALAAMVQRFRYLEYALALVLVFIGSKIFAADLLGLEKLPPALSLAVTVVLLGGGVVASLLATRGEAAAQTSADRPSRHG